MTVYLQRIVIPDDNTERSHQSPSSGKILAGKLGVRAPGTAWGSQTDSRGEALGLADPILDNANGLFTLENALSAFVSADRIKLFGLGVSAPTALFWDRACEGGVSFGFLGCRVSRLLAPIPLGLPVGWESDAWGSGTMKGI